ncbi:hypothetical protein B2M27_10945 [Kluyvera intermedia]|uniref:Transmembrane protein n=1 Tax=Kluyvera intermedia TaxID=61648 RepID=A0ABX3UGR4_KLUIN|nr:hypothetical protein [Kluyvera intermedia]ORJ50312.1 hypothetical protein B2M27_10945 [Kluyvera intermedia]
MKKYSYPFLFTLATAAVAAIFGFFVWRNMVYRPTFMSHTTCRYLVMTSLAATVLACFALRKRFAANIRTRKEYLKAWCGMALAMVSVFSALFTTLIWLLPGVESSYIAPYSYSAGGSRSCPGADVYDRELDKEIRICGPSGNVYSDRTVRVVKRSNALGMVVTDATTQP